MNEYILKIRMQAENTDKVKELGSLLQFAVSNIKHDELVKLLTSVRNNPNIVKTAIKFL